MKVWLPYGTGMTGSSLKWGESVVVIWYWNDWLITEVG